MATVDVAKIVADAQALAAKVSKTAGDSETPDVPAVPPTGLAASSSEARQLAAKAEELFTALDSTRDDFALAEDLLKQAVAKAPADAEVWAAYAYLHERYGARGWDIGNERHELARAAIQRALRLDPKSFEARFASAVLFSGGGEKENLEHERELRVLLQERPDDRRVIRALASVLRYLPNHEEEIIKLYDRAAQLPGGDPLALYNKALALWFAGREKEANAAVTAALAQQPFVSARLLNAFFALSVDGDLDRAKTLLEQLPSSALQDDRGCFFGYLVYAYRDEPEQALALLQSFSRDWINDNWFHGPRGLLVGNAQAQAGRPDAAAVEWRTALKVVDQRLAANPNNLNLLGNRLLLLAKVGDTAAARQLLPAVRQMLQAARNGELDAPWYALACLALGDRVEAMRIIGNGLKSKRHAIYYTASDLRHDPNWTALRGDPEFLRLIAEADRLERADAGEPASGATPPAAVVDAKSVAVLAFANLSDDKSNEYFSDGISEELLNVLAKVPGLKVTARTSSFYFKGKEVPVPEIAQQLGVAYLIEGSVRKQGDKVRITAQLIKAADGFQLWSDTFTRDLKDVFAVQDEIAGIVAKNLSLTMGLVATGPRREVNPAAHQLVLEGRYFLNLRTIEGFDRAETAFTTAIQLDPDFAQAHAGLGDVHWLRNVYACYAGANFLPSTQPDAETARALALDPTLAEAYPAAGSALHWTGHLAEAEQMQQKAIALNPNYALAHHWYSLVLEGQGRLDEALKEIEQAIQLDPLSVAALSTRHRFLFMAGRISEALVADEKLQVLRSRFFFGSGLRAQTLLAAGQREAALAQARAISAEPDLQLRWISDASAVYVLRALGHQAEAEAHVAKLLPRLPADSYIRGLALAALDRWDEARPYLERTPRGLLSLYFWNPIWDRWRDDPRFGQLMVKLNCVEEYKVARATLARMQREQAAKK